MNGVDDRLVIVVSGPGGVGKGTIVRELLDRDARLWLSQSWTTRGRRPGEAPDAYHFTDEAAFRARVEAGGFLEWVEFLDYLQGTPTPEPPPGHDVLFEIDVHGAAQIRTRVPDALLIFVDAPSVDEQQRRLRGRGDEEDKVRSRLAKANEEREHAQALAMTRVVNDDLDEAVTTIAALINERRSDPSRC